MIVDSLKCQVLLMLRYSFEENFLNLFKPVILPLPFFVDIYNNSVSIINMYIRFLKLHRTPAICNHLENIEALTQEKNPLYQKK